MSQWIKIWMSPLKIGIFILKNIYPILAKTLSTNAFQMPLELFAEASLKKLLYAVSMVANCVTRVWQ